MNTIKKTIITLALCLLSCNIVAFFGPSDNPGAGAFNGAATGALIGGIAGGGRGAGIGAGVGLGVGLMSSAAQNSNRRDRYDDRRGYSNNGYDPKSRTSMRRYIDQLEQENQNLKNENYDLVRQLNMGRQRQR